MSEQDKKGKQEEGEGLSQDIQNYLDLLLTPTSDPDNAAPEKVSAPEIPQPEAKPAVTTDEQATSPVNDLVSPESASKPKPLPATEFNDNEPVFKANQPVDFKPPASVSQPPVGRSRLSQAAQRKEQLKSLQQKPFAEPEKPLTLKMPLPKVQPPPPLAEHAPEVESKQELPAVESVDEVVVDSVDESVQSTDETAAHQTSVWLENGRPSWAQERFECLLFSVGGLTLAVPLVELGSIYPIGDQELTPLFGQINWFMGLLKVKDLNIRTVNTAKVVMPERYDEAMANNFNYVISINGVDWGLAVDNVANAITLEPDDVRWRSERSKRPWLAGTVVEHMCALLDVSQLANMFLEQDKNS